ncbi:NAD(P)H-binding protein [Micromonospora globbae]|uniref:NAD(P)H-binding protein n=1 Tax=Micromonospora globbae TaxID=1894969 RepID=UPI003F4E2E96
MTSNRDLTNEQGQRTILVLGATGKTGRRVVARLAEHPVTVREGSRSAAQPFDWTDRTTWAPVLQGVDAVYLSYHPDLAAPGAADTVGEFTRLAVASGVSRLVLLSGRGEEDAQASEKLVQDAGVEWTILRASWFSQNFSEAHLPDPVRDGEVVLPVGDVPEPFVDADDIAEVAVAALIGDGHAGQLHELTGPRLLTFAEAVAEISTATGRRIDYVQVSPEEYAAALTAEGLPQNVVDLLMYLFTTVLDGRNAHLADGVHRALGRPPRDFAEYAARTAATGIWNQR